MTAAMRQATCGSSGRCPLSVSRSPPRSRCGPEACGRSPSRDGHHRHGHPARRGGGHRPPRSPRPTHWRWWQASGVFFAVLTVLQLGPGARRCTSRRAGRADADGRHLEQRDGRARCTSPAACRRCPVSPSSPPTIAEGARPGVPAGAARRASVRSTCSPCWSSWRSWCCSSACCPSEWRSRTLHGADVLRPRDVGPRRDGSSCSNGTIG